MTKWRPHSYAAKDIVNNIKEKKFVIPQYQRGQVWNLKQEKKFIDSIKKGFPFGTLLLYEDKDQTYHIIDGLQRSTTIFKYLNNPGSFFNEANDLDDDTIEKIFMKLGIVANKESAIKSIKSIIVNWVKESHSNYTEVTTMQFSKCARKILQEFPTGKDVRDDIEDLLEPMFKNYIEECTSFNNAQIPVIIYEGDRSNLPEIFMRINSQGTNLTKYQILAATWSDIYIKITDPKLEPILNYIDEFFTTLIKANFTVEGYDKNIHLRNKELTLYQAIFGFGKLLKVQFPYLFGKSDKAKDVESCGFTLINACLGNKNSKLEELPNFIKTFNSDKDINDFLVEILETCEITNKIISPYNEFKLNKRSSVSTLHSELQICSLIANTFINKFGRVSENENSRSVNIRLGETNKLWRNTKKQIQKNAFYHYLSDILNQRWSGSGDSRLDEVIYNIDYYSSPKTKEDMEHDLTHWFSVHNASRNESTNVASPKDPEKLLLAIIYINSFTALDHLNDTKYDIEHLATKGAMRKHLKNFPANKLPISSFGNICLLPEYNNRRKKDKTIYMDNYYLTELHKSCYTLKDIEDNFSFTVSDNLDWINKEYDTFEDLKQAYTVFLSMRFEKQKEIILAKLFR